jgi:hypothetical protein
MLLLLDADLDGKNVVGEFGGTETVKIQRYVVSKFDNNLLLLIM